MNKYAVIKSGGKQRRVKVGDRFEVEKLSVEPGTEYIFDDVLLVGDTDGSLTIGRPRVQGAQVHAEVLQQERSDKILVVHFRRRKNSRRLHGHRQHFTRLKVLRIVTATSDSYPTSADTCILEEAVRGA